MSISSRTLPTKSKSHRSRDTLIVLPFYFAPDGFKFIPIHSLHSLVPSRNRSPSNQKNNLLLSAGYDQGSYNQGREQIPSDPYNQESGDTYGRPRGYEDSYGRDGEGSRGSYGNGYRETYGSRDDYGRVDPYEQRGYSQRGGGGGGGGYGAAGDSDTYPSSYTVVPVPGQIPPRNCTGSACCVPKCFAEKGSRVSDRPSTRIP